MASRSGFPYCTKWKNYRYPLTRLVHNTGFIQDTTSEGAFALKPLDIWVSDDYFLEALPIEYEVIMTTGTSPTNDKVTTLQRPRLFYDGKAGTNVATDATNPHGILDSPDNLTNLDTDDSTAETIGSGGSKQSLFTLIPGLHFGFAHRSETAYGTGDAFTWTMDASALDGLPKIIDGTYTCWHQMPLAGGDTVVTEPFPSGLGNKSITIMWNSKRHVSKRSSAAPNNGLSMTLQGSIDNVNYFDIVKLIDDISVIDTSADTDNNMVVTPWDSNALDGEDSLYKRLKFEYEAGGSTVTFHPMQFIEVSITPN